MFNGFALNNIQNCYVGGTAASAIYLGSTLIWPTTPPGPHDYSHDYLTFTSLADNNTIGWQASNANLLKTISISTDGGSTWTSYTSSTAGTTLATLNNGDKLLIKGSNTAYGTSVIFNYFTSTGNFNVEGNIMSLIYGDNFIGQTILDSSGYIFRNLFSNCLTLISVENLILPATTLAYQCYINMFRNCTSLTTAPALPATTLADYCYEGMFYGCTSLTTAPALPATTLTQYCYQAMFMGCTSLTTAPALPATTLADYCYWNMFYGCTSLTTAQSILPATTLAPYCYTDMFLDCASLTTAPELPATTLAQNCYQAMFMGCTSLTTAPELLATTLADDCYNSMFEGCTSLNYIKCLAIDISAYDCTYNWVYDVAASGTFVKDASMTSWNTGVSGIPSGWVVEDYHDYSRDYLTFKVTSDGTINFKRNGTVSKTIEYSLNNSTWTSKSTSAGLIIVSTGDVIRLRGNNTTYASSNQNYASFSGTAYFDVEGNIMSLVYGDNFIGNNTLTGTYNFCSMFKNAKVVSAENLILPAMTLTECCYRAMFNTNTLTKAPALPATTAAPYCYYYMFQNAIIEKAPDLPATTLGNFCYAYMFTGCAYLTTAPSILPATILMANCYRSMFNNCTSLITAPELSATTLADYCCQYMFSGCSSLTTAPVLPATTLASECYYYMFYGCTSLNYIKCLATSGVGIYTYNWVTGVAASGTFVKDANATWTTGNDGIPSGWTVQNA